MAVKNVLGATISQMYNVNGHALRRRTLQCNLTQKTATVTR